MSKVIINILGGEVEILPSAKSVTQHVYVGPNGKTRTKTVIKEVDEFEEPEEIELSSDDYEVLD